ncbi:MAG: flagellar export chaperone FlgN [Phycisphaerae bacterium]
MTAAHQPEQAYSLALASAAQDICECFTELYTGMTELADLAEQKLAAVRRADTAALAACTSAEAERLNGVARLDQRRAAALAALAQQLHDPTLARARLEEIAKKLPVPFSARLQAKSTGLRQIAERLQEKNRVFAGVARNLQSHVRAVLNDLTGAAAGGPAYGRDGKMETAAGRCLVDALG